MQDTVIISQSIEPTSAGIQKWCQDYVANLLDVQPDKIDPTTEFDRFGLNSAMAVAMCLDLEEQLGFEIPPALLFEYTSIAELATYVAGAVAHARGATT